MTLAHSIKYPWKDKYGDRSDFITIWHVDPCKGPGGDDSCGWLMRAYHGDEKMLEKIVKRFDFDWDRVFKSDSGKTYYCGYFYPELDGAGMPNMGVTAIALNLFWLAALEMFGRDKADRYCRKHLFDIMHFAENPMDSLRDSIIQKFGAESSRQQRIRSMASCIYAYILRGTRPWYKHPRWHVHHWKFQCHPLQGWIRWLKRRCKVCKRRISPSDHGVCADGWGDNSPLTCGKCSSACQAAAIP